MSGFNIYAAILGSNRAAAVRRFTEPKKELTGSSLR